MRFLRSLFAHRSFAGQVLLCGGICLCTDTPAHAVHGATDPTFTAEVADTTFPGRVHAIAVQPDGKILIGGRFSFVSGVARSNIARLDADGTLDAGFTAATGGVNPLVESLVVQPDGRILAAGWFTTMNGVNRTKVARLNPDGTLDMTLSIGVGGGLHATVALQADGKILVGVGASFSGGVWRYLTNGTPDPGFANPPTSTDGDVHCLLPLPDGRILVAGRFTSLGGVPRKSIARLNANGTVDAVFNPDAAIGTNSGTVSSIAVQVDERILLGGSFLSVGGQPRSQFARIAADGSVEGTDTFHPPTEGVGVYSIALQSNGKILVGRGSKLHRLLPDGTADPAWAAGSVSDGAFWCLAVQADGKLLAGGDFTQLTAEPRAGLARLESDIVQQTLSVLGTTEVRWVRKGAEPIVADVTFASSIDGGNTWNPLGPGARIPDGWMLDGLDLPANFTLRARGRSGDAGSSSLVEQQHTFPDTTPPDIHILGNNPAAALVGTAYTDAGVFAFDAVNGQETVSVSSTVDTGTPGDYAVTYSATDEKGNATQAVRVVNVGYRLPAGNLDPFFAPVITHDIESPEIMAVAIEPDGAILIGGMFTHVNGTPRSNLARLLANGALDFSFNPGSGTNGAVQSIAVQEDGRILIGGEFSMVDGQPHSRLVRLNANGMLESPSAINESTGVIAPGDEENRYALAIQPDGRIVFVGDFYAVQGQSRRGIARLLANGSVENPASFSGGGSSNYDGSPLGIFIQPDGKLLVCGTDALLRLNANGSRDQTFQSGGDATSVYCAGLQSDGRILACGHFTNPGNEFVRFLPGGSSDPALFRVGTLEGIYRTMALQVNGRTLTGGGFITVGGMTRLSLAPFESSGALPRPEEFPARVTGSVSSLALDDNGMFLAGGRFNSANGQPRSKLARFFGDAAVVNLQVVSPSEVQWLRGGGCPELAYVKFELSTDAGANWSALGDGLRMAGGWRITGLDLPAPGTVRARGRFTNGVSTSLVQQTKAFDFTLPPLLLAPSSGATVTRPLSVKFIMPENALPGSVTLQLAADTVITLRLSAAFESAGTHTITFAPGTPLASPGIVSGQGIPDGAWSLSVSCQDAAGNAAATSSAAAIIVDTSPLTVWKFAELGDVAAADLDDSDHDGLTHLVEYALQLSPLVAEGEPLAPVLFDYSDGRRWRIMVPRDPARSDVSLFVEVSDRPAGPWVVLAGSLRGASFGGDGYVTGEIPGAGPRTVEVRDTVTADSAARRFVRVRVAR